MTIKYNRQYLLDKAGSTIDAKLRLRLVWKDRNGDRAIVATNIGYRITIDKWSKETNRCKNNTTHGKRRVQASTINQEIARYEQITDDVFASFELKEINPTAEEYRVALGSATGSTKRELGFFDIFDEFTTQVGDTNNWTESSYEKFAALKNHLEKFDPNITFSKFDEDGLNALVKYFQDDCKMRNSTIENRMDFVRWFLRWAIKKGYSNETTIEDFKPKLKTTDKKVIFLEWEELMRVYNFEFPAGKEALGRVRDVFCFCCFTSLRYSDVANLRRSDIFDTYILVTTIKTADSLKIELNDYSRAILAKYKDADLDNNMALPVISNQRMNEHLKLMGEVCGIDQPVRITYYVGNKRHDEIHPKYELLGTHAGRRTFICNALMLGIPVDVVMKWTGHSDYKAMKPYIDIADSAKANAMNLFNKR